MVFGSELVECLNNCEYVKGLSHKYKCFDCPMFINDTPCKELIVWWTKQADLNLRKIRKERKKQNA